MAARCVLAAEDGVGESLVWDERAGALWWVDITGRRIHRLEPASGAHETWPTPEFPTSIGLAVDGGFVVGLMRRVCRWRPGGAFETLCVPEPDMPDNRLNEGRVAPDGSLWVGTMQNNLAEDGAPRPMDRNSGAVWRVAPDGTAARLTPAEFGITNTMAWTADGRFLVADTLANEIYAYDVDGLVLRNKRVFAAGMQRGLPDGSCLDADGRLWNCRVGGGAAVACFAGDGTPERLLDLPCSWPTSCTFAGADFSTLYVTSARFTMSGAHIAAHPLEGALFAVDGAGRGVAEPRFRG